MLGGIGGNAKFNVFSGSPDATRLGSKEPCWGIEKREEHIFGPVMMKRTTRIVKMKRKMEREQNFAEICEQISSPQTFGKRNKCVKECVQRTTINKSSVPDFNLDHR